MSLAGKIMGAMGWSMIEKIGGNLIRMVFLLWLVRILTPAEIGVVAYAGFFIMLSATLVDMGLPNSLVQRDEINQAHIDSVLWTNVAIGALLFMALQIGAVPLGELVREPMLGLILPTMAASFLLGSVAAVPLALLRRAMNFQLVAAINFVSLIFGTLVGVYIVYHGGGVWGLIALQVVQSAVAALMAVWLNPASLGIELRWSALSQLLSFSLHSFALRIIGVINSKGTTFIIGYLVGSALLGFFSVAQRLYKSVDKVFREALGRVLLPALSSIQKDKQRVAEDLHKLSIANALFFFPWYLVMLVAGGDLVEVLAGSKWGLSGELLALLALTGFSRTIGFPMRPVLMSQGRPDVLTWLNIIGTVGKLGAFWLFTQQGLDVAILAWVVFIFSFLPVRLYVFSRVLDYPVLNYLKPYAKPLLFCVLIYLFCQAVLIDAVAGFGVYARLALVIAFVVTAYVGLALLLARSDIRLATTLVRKKRGGPATVG